MSVFGVGWNVYRYIIRIASIATSKDIRFCVVVVLKSTGHQYFVNFYKYTVSKCCTVDANSCMRKMVVYKSHVLGMEDGSQVQVCNCFENGFIS